MNFFTDNFDLILRAIELIILLSIFLVKGKDLGPALIKALQMVSVRSAEAQKINTIMMQSIDFAREVIGEDTVSQLTDEIAQRATAANISTSLDKTLEASRASYPIGKTNC